MKIGLGEGIPLNVICDWNCAEVGATLASQASQVKSTNIHSFKLTLMDVE